MNGVIFFVGLAEMGLEIGHRLLAYGLGPPFLTYNREETVLLNDEGACVDGGGDGDGVSAFRGKLHARLELFEEIVNGCGRLVSCAHTHCVGGKLVVVDLPIRRPEVVKEESCGERYISDVVVI